LRRKEVRGGGEGTRNIIERKKHPIPRKGG